RAALDARPAGPVVELPAAVALDVHAPRRLPATAPTPLGALVGGTLALLRLPVVADLLEAVLQRGVGHTVGALLVALVLLVGRVEGLGEGALRLGGRALQRVREIGLAGLRHALSSPGPGHGR